MIRVNVDQAAEARFNCAHASETSAPYATALIVINDGGPARCAFKLCQECTQDAVLHFVKGLDSRAQLAILHQVLSAELARRAGEDGEPS